MQRVALLLARNYAAHHMRMRCSTHPQTSQPANAKLGASHPKHLSSAHSYVGSRLHTVTYSTDASHARFATSCLSTGEGASDGVTTPLLDWALCDAANFASHACFAASKSLAAGTRTAVTGSAAAGSAATA